MPENKKGKILIVEDDPGVAELERQRLERAGYTVAVVATTDAAMEQVQQGGLDLILSDYSLPRGVTGLQFHARLKEGGYSIPVIIVSGTFDERTVIEALRAGVQDFIAKSTEFLDYLPQAVERVLEREWTKRKLVESQEELKRSASLLLSTIEATADGLLVVNLSGRITRYNRRFAEMWRIPAEVLETKDDNRAIAFVLDQLKQPEEFLKKVRELYSQPMAECFDILEFKDGRVFERACQPQLLDDKPVGLVLSFRDVTERKKAEQQLDLLAHQDALTHLPNRLLFMDRLGQGLAQASRSERLVAVLFLDLDRFKVINDSLGHAVGDLLLKAVAERLIHSVRKSDTVARLGGDEFTVILTHLSHAEDAGRVARKILEAFFHPVHLAGPEIFITPSIGIALYPSDAQEADTLLKCADMAMYRAKEHGRNNFQFYTEEMNVTALERLTLENSLRHALERSEFILHYQPQVDLGSGKVVCAEALVRWNHPQMGLILPGRFITLAEETGLINPLGDWVLRTACAQGQAWRKAALAPIRVAVNLSGRQLRQKNLVENIDKILKQTGFDPKCLDLELTESSIIPNGESALKALRDLKTLGIQISLDDFGTGYSALTCLKQFPIDHLKIGQSFVHGLPARSEDVSIAAAMIELAHSLKLKVIAEGVETREQLAFLRAQGCDLIQGHLFCGAVPAEKLARVLGEGT